MRVTSPWKIAGGYVSTNHTACAVIPHLSDGRFGHEFEPSDVDPPQGRVPALIAAAGARVSRRFFEFFAVNIRNPHTRRAQDRSAEQSARS